MLRLLPGTLEEVAQFTGGIVVYGHNHVDDAIETLPSGGQFRNGHEHVVILTHPDR